MQILTETLNVTLFADLTSKNTVIIYSLFLGFYVSFHLFFFWPHISGLLILCWPFGKYVLCLYFYVIACTSMSLLVDELNK